MIIVRIGGRNLGLLRRTEAVAGGPRRPLGNCGYEKLAIQLHMAATFEMARKSSKNETVARIQAPPGELSWGHP